MMKRAKAASFPLSQPSAGPLTPPSSSTATVIDVEEVGGSRLQSAVASALPVLHRSSGGFAQTFGLDYRIALMAIGLDSMLFATTTFSMGLLLPLAFMAGLVFSLITYKAQKKWYGDDSESALIKALIVGLLTAIPVGIPALLYIPSGVLGGLKMLRGK